MSEAIGQSEIPEGYEEVEFGPKTIVVPSDWSTVRFGEVFNHRRESIDTDERETVRYVGLKHLDSGELDISGYDEDGAERSSSRAFREGDVLFGKLRPNLNKAAIAPFDGICSSDIIPIYSEDPTLQRYLPYLMHSTLIRDRVVSTMEGTNLPRTSWTDLGKTLIPLPPESERRRITEILAAVNDEIQQTDQSLEEARSLEKGLTQDLLQSGIGHTSLTTVSIGPREYQLPVSWEVEQVEDILDQETDKKPIRGGPPGGRISKKDRVEEGPKVYVQENIIYRDYSMGTEYLTEEKFEELKSAALEPGDVVITRAGTVGRTDVFPETARKGIMDSSLIRLKVNQQRVRPEYLAAYISDSPISQFQIESMSHGGTRTNINNQIIKSLKIPLPPLDEQDRIIEIHNVAQKKVEQERETKQRLRELRQGLMQDLLTGKVRVSTGS
jgi:type I restriction enzyme S subunit